MRAMHRRRFASIRIVCAPLAWLAAGCAASAATFVVTNSADTATPGTLRWALISANTSAGPDTIAFALNPPYTISPTGDLPRVTNNATSIQGDALPPRTIIAGTLAGYFNGLTLDTVSSCLVERLIIRNFQRDGVALINTTGCTVRACVILNNLERGIGVGGVRNTVGGTNTADRNFIASNSFYNVEIAGLLGTGNLVAGNYIGTDSTGSNRWTGGSGVIIRDAVSNRVSGNVIASGGQCVRILGTNASYNQIHGNLVGTDASGQRRLGATEGVRIEDGHHNEIGGISAGQGNVIAGCGIGVYILGQTAHENLLAGNRIGLAADGQTLLTNSTRAVEIANAPSNRVGTGTAAGRNLIGGSDEGIFIWQSNAVGNVIRGNYIGVASNGLSATSNRNYNILVRLAAGTFIGGTNAGEGNVLSGCRGTSVYLDDGASNSIVQGNLIGLDAGGAVVVSNRSAGLNIRSGNNLVGGGLGAGNIISGNGSAGLALSTSNAAGNRVFGNTIGLDAARTAARPNQQGLFVNAAISNRIGDAAEHHGNHIGGSLQEGVFVQGAAHDNIFAHNTIGLTQAVNGTDGISFSAGAYSNLVLGGHGDARPIGANGRYGIRFSYATGNVVRGYAIGNDGQDPVTNGSSGVYISYSPGTELHDCIIGGNGGIGVEVYESPACRLYTNYIGISAAGLALTNQSDGVNLINSPDPRLVGNVIALNRGNGVSALRAHRAAFLGNRIGLAADGVSPRGNASYGLYLLHCISNVIGAAGAGNVIGANGQDGVAILFPDSEGCIVQGNRIGVTADGASAVPNLGNGIQVNSARALVGGTGAGEGNHISGNTNCGVSIVGGGVAGIRVYGNLIGTDGAGTNALGNGSHGIHIWSGAASNAVGGAGASSRNTIAFNGGDGVRIGENEFDVQAERNTVAGNIIHGNRGLGIDLMPAGPTPNDAGDLDAGPNGLQNFPVLTVATGSSGSVHIEGHLAAIAGQTYLIDFFGGQTLDPSGHGEGERPLGSTYVTLPGAGVEYFTNSFAVPPPLLSYVSATATRIDGLNGETSEFAYRRVVDSDGDGMPDGYEAQYHGGATNGNPAVDDDNDGVSNLAEFLHDTAPNSPASFPVVRAAGTGTGMVYVTGTHSYNRNYRLMISSNLVESPAAVWAELPAGLTRDGAWCTLDAPAPPGTSVYFGVKAELP